MAAERTWLAWWRTALTATAGALAVGRFAPELLDVAPGPYVLLGCGYGALALGLLPREALKALRMVAREGICGREVVEIAPPYDVSDMTAQLGCRAIMDVLGTLVEEGHLGSRTKAERERDEQARAERERAEQPDED